MSPETVSTAIEEKGVNWRRLLSTALLAMAASSIANIVLYWIAAALFPDVTQFPMLGVPNIIISTVAFLLLATLVLAIVARFSSRPARHYRIVGIVALLLSLAAPLSAGTAGMQGVRAGPATVVVLLLMHLIAGTITIYLFTTRAVEP